MLLASHRHRFWTGSKRVGVQAPASPMQAPTVLVVDGHLLFRSGVRLVLEEGGLRVVGEAASGDEALALVLEHAPAVVIIDADLPPTGATSTIRRLAECAPEVPVLVLADVAGPAEVAEAVLAGAKGYLLKDSPSSVLAAGIRAVAGGASLVLPPSAVALLRHSGAGRGTMHPLTTRELQVLGLMASGRDNGEIAAELFISPRTAKSHVSHILRKLQAENRTQASVYAARAGLV